VESLATQSLVIFVIRTRRVPFLRSRPGRLLAATTLLVVVVGALLPASPPGGRLGFTALPPGFFAVLVVMVAAYLALTEAAKHEFYTHFAGTLAQPPGRHRRRLQRRAAPFSHPDRLPPRPAGTPTGLTTLAR
jgi:P-type Mg2+ transporter